MIKSPLSLEIIEKLKREAAIIKLASDLIIVHEKFLQKLDEVNSTIHKKVGPAGPQGPRGYAGRGEKGDKGDKGDTPDVMAIARATLSLIKLPQDGRDAVITDEHIDEAANRVMKRIRQAKNGNDAIVSKELVKRIADEVSNEFKLSPEALVEAMKGLPKGKRLSSSFIDGFEQTAISIYHQMHKGYLHGGGDTVKAGTNVTLTRNSDGTTTISSSGSGGSSIAMQSVNAVQSGSDVTIDLTQLAHTFTGVLMITDQGQTLDTTRWSIVGTTATVTNTFSTDSFQVQYVY